jgi:hypothetical protein
MNKELYACYKSGQPCSSIWGCHFLTVTPPARPEDKETTFVSVYREAKNKDILSCPKFVPTKIDEYLDKV